MKIAKRARCIYCGRSQPETEAYYENAPVPEVDDEDFWRLVRVQHDTDCEWVKTRAHRVFAGNGVS